ncbi:MAG TPA: hypothetical protein VG651_22270 [Stellaceae bacterium]|nr:hypothetical protein [Stellaceae bacterium]
MAATATSDADRRQPDTPPPDKHATSKRVISSVVTHEKLMAEIKQRNPIIANRDKPKR